MQLFSHLQLDDLMLERAGVGKGYSNSKYANSLFTKTLSTRLSHSGVSTFSMCPGIVNTAITRHHARARRWFWKFALSFVGFSADQV
jgi:NAD(P)-dependent dehydrogenase (short-subunit alcohol dehydrogenase family)